MIWLAAGPLGLVGLLQLYRVGLNPGHFGVWDCVQRGQKGSGGLYSCCSLLLEGAVSFAWLAAWPGDPKTGSDRLVAGALVLVLCF